MGNKIIYTWRCFRIFVSKPCLIAGGNSAPLVLTQWNYHLVIKHSNGTSPFLVDKSDKSQENGSSAAMLCKQEDMGFKEPLQERIKQAVVVLKFV